MAVSDGQIVRLAIKLTIDFLVPFPNRIPFTVPGKLMSMNQSSRCDSGDDYPMKKAVGPGPLARKLSSMEAGSDPVSS